MTLGPPRTPSPVHPCTYTTAGGGHTDFPLPPGAAPTPWRPSDSQGFTPRWAPGCWDPPPQIGHHPHGSAGSAGGSPRPDTPVLAAGGGTQRPDPAAQGGVGLGVGGVWLVGFFFIIYLLHKYIVK